MNQKVIKIAFLVLLVVCSAVYINIFKTNIQFESYKTQIKSSFRHRDKDDSVLTDLLNSKKMQKYNYYWQNHEGLELYLRYQLLYGTGLNEIVRIQLKEQYRKLMQYKPTWPYYYSGIAQVNVLDQSYDPQNNQLILQYGPYEKTVILSLAEVVFSQWDDVPVKDRNNYLRYLINQRDYEISRIVTISERFAKLYQFCDFIFDEKRIEYAACQKKHWQPLID